MLSLCSHLALPHVILSQKSKHLVILPCALNLYKLASNAFWLEAAFF
jgi:hypothetical protein